MFNSDVPVCHLAVGELRGALDWASDGKRFLITHVERIAIGKRPGKITIQKEPL